MKPRKTLSVYVLLVGVLGLSVVGGILAFQIFSASVKNQLTTAQKEAVKPIDGAISQLVINNLQQRKIISETELGALVALTPTPTISIVQPTPEATQAAGLPTPTMTPSATISATPTP